MTIPLPNDLALKIRRAETLLRELDDVCRSYTESDPIILVPVPENRDSREASWGVRAKATSDAPEELSALVGDIVNNIRAPLDYLARALVVSNGGVPVDGRGPKTAFPLVHTRPASTQGVAVSGGVHPAALEKIRDLQPYNNTLEGRALGLLSRLSNEDKHRAPHVTAAGMAIPSGVTLKNVGQAEPYGMVTPLMRSLRDGEWAIMPIFPAPLGARVIVSGSRVRSIVTLPSDGPLEPPVQERLDFLLRVVRDRVLPQFREFFAEPWPSDVFSEQAVVDPLGVMKARMFDGLEDIIIELFESERPADGSDPRVSVLSLTPYVNVDPRLLL
jgi:hypothetical protein